mmetsp:Transcript_73436/g.203956  ORF Transcript_73436/g.203956 Transcript_73436/m.203956 type:complete len:267 (-) Transcript_73436:538-1338(-)
MTTERGRLKLEQRGGHEHVTDEWPQIAGDGNPKAWALRSHLFGASGQLATDVGFYQKLLAAPWCLRRRTEGRVQPPVNGLMFCVDAGGPAGIRSALRNEKRREASGGRQRIPPFPSPRPRLRREQLQRDAKPPGGKLHRRGDLSLPRVCEDDHPFHEFGRDRQCDVAPEDQHPQEVVHTNAVRTRQLKSSMREHTKHAAHVRGVEARIPEASAGADGTDARCDSAGERGQQRTFFRNKVGAEAEHETMAIDGLTEHRSPKPPRRFD